MRNLFVAAVVIVLIMGFAGGFTVARTRYKPLLEANSKLIIAKDKEIKTLKEKNLEYKNIQKNTDIKYFLQKDKLMEDDGKLISEVKKDIILSNGTKIMVGGIVQKKDGTKIKLSEGEFFGLK